MKKFRYYFWSKGEPWNSVRSWLVPRILRVLHSVLMCTLRISASGVRQSSGHMEAARTGSGSGVLFVTWHDLTLMPLHLFRNKNIGVMMSRSHSGQIQSTFFGMYGWPTVWGSTNKREGIRALREVTRLLQSGQSFAFTVDGPKGPRHEAHPGAIHLATKAQTVLLPLGVAASSFWRLPTWDKYLIPKPFARVHVHIGASLQLPTDIARDETETWQQKIGEIINAASAEAEQRIHRKS